MGDTMATQEAYVQVKDLKKHYGDGDAHLTVLDGIDTSINLISRMIFCCNCSKHCCLIFHGRQHRLICWEICRILARKKCRTFSWIVCRIWLVYLLDIRWD